ncbi:MAG: SCO family protein [Candidatus Hodarchaeales archaeon]|jgi:protein SCO1/2
MVEQNTIVGTVIGIMILAGVGAAFVLYPLAQNQMLPNIKPAPDFTLINQDNETVALQQFSGKVIMLGFLYTSCSDDLCSLMTYDFKTIQTTLSSYLGSDAMLICITLDPLFDTPNVLKNYALQNGVNLSMWQFLTAYELATIQQVVDDYGVLSYVNELEELANVTDDNATFKNKVSHDNETRPSILIHSWISMLIDENLMIRKVYTRVSWVVRAAIEDMKSLL